MGVSLLVIVSVREENGSVVIWQLQLYLLINVDFPKRIFRTLGLQDLKSLSNSSLCRICFPRYRATSREVDDEDRAFFYKELCETGLTCPFQWILGPELPQIQAKNPLMPQLIEDLVEDFLSNKEAFIEKCNDAQIKWLASNTVEQRLSPMWAKFRRLRLTGSNFGAVLKAIQRNKNQNRPYPPSLFKTLRMEYSLGKKDAIMWGQMHEEMAIQSYSQITGNTVTKTGLHLFPCGFLGSSPDGIISVPDDTENIGVIEVKCTFKYRNASISEIIQNELPDGSKGSSFYLKKDGHLRENHEYWHQVQAEMASVGVNWAHFVLWTLKETYYTQVIRDPNWEKISLPVLQDFYLNELFPTFYTKDKKLIT
ncbi:uncharacterized protein LOC135689022 [Rhopilema esculentum]|uniref:uncharacterized protein LOC135689022 n=1 Tax=Rhopilema esculentum TaxID=499914 RepID=UPI0031D14B6A